VRSTVLGGGSGPEALFMLGDPTLSALTETGAVVALFQKEIPQATTEAIIRECRKRKMLVVWNTAPACQKKPSRETLEGVDFLICNRPELRVLVGDGDIEATARKLRSWGLKDVVVTLGEKGCLLVTGEEAYHQAAFAANVVDTVGTGDCFCGVFASSLSSGVSVKESIRRASAAAALSATVRGAQPSMPSAEKIDEFLSATREAPVIPDSERDMTDL